MQAAADAVESGMVSVIGLDAAKTEALCAKASEDSGKKIQVANYLCKGNYTVSGDKEACAKLAEIAKPEFKARMAVPLAVAGAFHTDFMAPAVAKLEEVLSSVDLKKPQIPVVSNVDAKSHSDPEMIKAILAKQVTAPVQWETQMKVMRQMSDVRALKKRLQGLCGLSSFRQQLLHNGAVLDDETKLARLELPVDLQLVLLSFGSGSLQQRNNFSFAVGSGQTSEVQRMLQIPHDPDLVDEFGETPLLVATNHGHVEVALLLLDAGADVNLPNLRGWTALTRSSAEGRMDFVRLLLEAGADTECTGGESNEAALLQAVQQGHVGIVRLLLGSRANVSLRSKSDGQTPLTRVSLSGHTEIVRMLLKSRAEVDAVDNCGATALMFASSRGNADIVSILLEAGASKDMATTRGDPFLIQQDRPDSTHASLLRWQSGSRTIAAAQPG
ncbi:unnamed protein product [Symbiodinium microadriaticum]|nr:unnamed protein product [Symbiodinium microadriaticum]CAE7948216.1 unnamed protein product [Symbiodinium sp. KB8]